MLEALTVDQIRVFIAVVECGSFSAAARSLNRAQTVITYTIKKLEEQVGTPLFERSAYRPQLTVAGAAMLPHARRIHGDVLAMRLQAEGIASGLEPELSLVVDAMFPMERVADALTAFQKKFPGVRTRLYVETLASAMKLVLDDECSLGILANMICDRMVLSTTPLLDIDLAMVVAPAHPLAAYEGPVPKQILHDHMQLVVTDRTRITANRDFGVFGTQTWRLGDLGSKRTLLNAGLGYGTMPVHMIGEDLAKGTLVKLRLEDWGGGESAPPFAMCLAHRFDKPPGPATRWLQEYMIATSRNVDAA